MIITQDTIADTIREAPAWALLGLTAPRETLREDASREVARHVYQTLYRPSGAGEGQLRLPL